MTRAIFGAQAAGRAFVRVDIPGIKADPGLEITRFAGQGKKIGIAQNFDIGRPTGLNKLRRQDSE